MFSLYAQIQGDACEMPIEDPTVPWIGAKEVKLATITIPKQNIDDVERSIYCENLSFNPWRVPEANRPLGTK